MVRVLKSCLQPEHPDPFDKYSSSSSSENDDASGSDAAGTGSKFIPGFFKVSAAQKAKEKEKKREARLANAQRPSMNKFDMAESTFHISANTDLMEFRRLVADYFVIPHYQAFSFYDEYGNKLEKEVTRLRSMTKIMDFIREGNPKEVGSKEDELDNLLKPDGKSYNILYLGDKKFKDTFWEWVNLKKEAHRRKLANKR